ncbi:2-succinyl-5-enolpyruvyl-6-hydroxy-3-cyclohexene-1-carboxylic-acid synthase [Bacillus fonticola]|uniref:2-succinyl-5-enolpyruvyl-6-hydroxy-3- cyclohexene-1-carboxylic-acid synthase n=1 Tax=Bacillus fonticola TaxID=2728853 RepID=UPI001472D66E|nr:2-succinyl-5-enolpyruvyl-6-hydroxy-3-cyclohexene-1-carboxylic-acid synthase [Bacillus fonticola]
MGNDNTRAVYHFLESLISGGITDIVVSPGSRSTPLALVAHRDERLNVHVILDERSASFYALGLAKVDGKAIALLCTSGTASANYYPAIIEAYYSHVPLVVITADRPHELREVGAPQAIDQLHMYGKYAKHFVDLPIAEEHEMTIQTYEQQAFRSVVVANQHPKGPVHLNVPFREPLVPDLLEERPTLYQNRSFSKGRIRVEEPSRWREAFANCDQGMIICGQLANREEEQAVLQLAESFQYPVLCDPLSNLRKYDHPLLVRTYDALLRNHAVREHLLPEQIIRFGAMPVSKSLSQTVAVEWSNARHVYVGEGFTYRDPAYAVTDWVEAEVSTFCRDVIPDEAITRITDWVVNWQLVEASASKAMSDKDKLLAWHEGQAMEEVLAALPEGTALFVGNSMPIRDLDTFSHGKPLSCDVYANRGANGIDGVISTAIGVSERYEQTYLVIGDLSTLHDLGGHLIAKLRKSRITIVVFNNNGGGIFSFLPQAKEKDVFEPLFGTPMDVHFKEVASMFQGEYQLVTGRDELRQALRTQGHSSWQLVEVLTNREQNVEQHRNLFEFVSREMDKLVSK